MRPTVVLFDVDGTLVSTGGAGRRAMEDAFEAVCGRRDACEAIAFAGSTDRAIVRAGLRAAGCPDDAAWVERVLDVYLERLPVHLARASAYRVHPGVVELLDALAAAADAGAPLTFGLGTGNVEAGARAKLRPAAGLDRRFTFGGFGCDAEDRAELLRVGLRRGAARLGEAPEACRAVVVGDTARDVAAAHAVGAECLAVATGFGSPESLQEAEAVVSGLDDPLALQVLLEEREHRVV